MVASTELYTVTVTQPEPHVLLLTPSWDFMPPTPSSSGWPWERKASQKLYTSVWADMYYSLQSCGKALSAEVRGDSIFVVCAPSAAKEDVVQEIVDVVLSTTAVRERYMNFKSPNKRRSEKARFGVGGRGVTPSWGRPRIVWA